IQYDEIVRPERIVYRHGGGDDAEPIKFQSTITLAAKGERTEVTLHLVFDTPEERNHVVEKYGAIEGGNQTLGRLAEFVEKSGVAPEFILHRTFNAPRDVVYKAFTEEDRLAKWWGPKGLKMLHCKLDLRPGGLFHYGMSTPDGKEMWGKWVFREVQPPMRLVYVVSFSDKDGGTTRAPFNLEWPLEVLASVTFKDEGEKTTITMTSTPINATEAERKAFGGHFESMKAGFGGTLDQLDVFLANG
ncbi:MAG TPA: SRPBCC family protein, partial [Gemmata sp.]|nr:SRPBCC family protein [Gemmata sp.]